MKIGTHHYTSGDVVEIANYLNSLKQRPKVSAEAAAREVIPMVLALLQDRGPLCECGRELNVLLFCGACDNDE